MFFCQPDLNHEISLAMFKSWGCIVFGTSHTLAAMFESAAVSGELLDR